MANAIPRIPFPELFVGFVAPIGTELDGVIESFEKQFRLAGYNAVHVKVTQIFSLLESSFIPKRPIVHRPLHQRYLSHIAYGNQLRQEFDDDAVLAELALARIVQRRLAINKDLGPQFEKTVFIIHQFKRKEEIDLMRSVYGRLFFQVSVYSRRESRIQYLSKRFAEDINSADNNRFRAEAEEIVQIDENEKDVIHGQRVSKIFHDADLIINLNTTTTDFRNQTARFCDLLFGSNSLSPTKMEYGMFAARAAALRTLDLSRQVGAAIFTESGEIVALGSNEVPKAGGGTYWCDGDHDDRDYKRKQDSNYKRKRELLMEILNIVLSPEQAASYSMTKEIADSQFMDALEYGRIIHAEMAALMDAARLGRSTSETVLFSTTFPCHMCAKHIVAAGIKRVIFLEPYPKSLAAHLHSDSICVEGSDRGQYQTFPHVLFEHFWGVSPRRYRELFEASERKTDDGAFEDWRGGEMRPIIDIKFPFYGRLEEEVIRATIKKYFPDLSLAAEE